MLRLRSIFDALLAALTLYTRLPFWRLRNLPAKAFSQAAGYWPFAGWLTGGCLALSLLAFSSFLPMKTAVILAIASRVLFTGAMHEDGLADFADGFGGGHGRENILHIMKDSHIGTFGVIALIIYFFILHTTISCLTEDNNIWNACAVILLTDVWSKCCASLLISQLPYARKQEQAKIGVVYDRLGLAQGLRILLAAFPALAIAFLAGVDINILPLIVPIATENLLMLYCKSRLQGYTGDCCGATFLLCEMVMYLAWCAIAVA